MVRCATVLAPIVKGGRRFSVACRFACLHLHQALHAPTVQQRRLRAIRRACGRGFKSSGPAAHQLQCVTHQSPMQPMGPDARPTIAPVGRARWMCAAGKRSQGGVKFPTGGDGLHAGTSPRAPALPSWRCGVSRPGVTPGPTVWRRLVVQGAAHSPDERERGPMPWPSACALCACSGY